MKNIFAKFQEYVNKPKRNVFDMSFRNNLTLKFGELTPVFCKEVIPGDSFKIHTAFGLQMMPMKFPVQTPMKAYIHFFYVRNRTLWKDWMDFIGGTKENLIPPYVTPIDKQKFFRVGGLADYLGVPNVVYGAYGSVQEDVNVIEELSDGDAEMVLNPLSWSSSESGNAILGKYFNFVENNDKSPFRPAPQKFINPVIAPLKKYNWQATDLWTADSIVSNATGVLDVVLSADQYKNYINTNQSTTYPVCATLNVVGEFTPRFVTSAISFTIRHKWVFTNSVDFPANSNGLNWETQPVPVYLICVGNGTFGCWILESTKAATTADVHGDLTFSATIPNEVLTQFGIGSKYYICLPSHTKATYSGSPHEASKTFLFDSTTENTVKINYNYSGVISTIYDEDLTTSPYDSDIHLNALPFRAYESIYNAYYRNPQNNPFVLDGVAEYNRYNTSYEGGADTTQYDLFYRNWEYDFLTSAVQSPQQGVAPLVGMSMTGEATFADEEGNTYYAQAILNDDGEITGWQSHSSNMPVGSLRLLMDMAGTGISINDLRNVNAFQRFLENNIRHGLKYKDQVMSHFGVKIRYDELDMPEFIGGVSTMIDVNKLSQTSNSGDTPLGSFVGQASALAESNHDITHYCDEHGFIMGIMSIVPIPVYSQLLPKFFIKSTQLDYYFPEFGHIGYQPIQQKEVSPLQTFYANDDLNKVFGYNRAWYDYLASTDEVHGQFRTTMRDFLMNRTFDSEPELSEEFLLVDPNQLNDVFLAGTDDDLYAPEADKIIGSILFNVSAKRPIPLFGIPKLEG